MSSTLCNVHLVRDEFEGGPAILVDFNRGASGCARSVLAKKYQILHSDRNNSRSRIEMRAGRVKAADVGSDSYRSGGKVLGICEIIARRLEEREEKLVNADKWLAAVVYEMKAQGVLVAEKAATRQRSMMEEDKGCCVVQ